MHLVSRYKSWRNSSPPSIRTSVEIEGLLTGTILLHSGFPPDSTQSKFQVQYRDRSRVVLYLAGPSVFMHAGIYVGRPEVDMISVRGFRSICFCIHIRGQGTGKTSQLATRKRLCSPAGWRCSRPTIVPKAESLFWDTND